MFFLKKNKKGRDQLYFVFFVVFLELRRRSCLYLFARWKEKQARSILQVYEDRIFYILWLIIRLIRNRFSLFEKKEMIILYNLSHKNSAKRNSHQDTSFWCLFHQGMANFHQDIEKFRLILTWTNSSQQLLTGTKYFVNFPTETVKKGPNFHWDTYRDNYNRSCETLWKMILLLYWSPFGTWKEN